MKRLLLLTVIAVGLLAGGGGSGAQDGAEKASKPELTTVAGDGGEQLGDGGPATEAGLCGPNDVALDASHDPSPPTCYSRIDFGDGS